MNLPTGRRGKLVALALLVICSVLVFELAVQPTWRAYMSLRDDIDEAGLQLQLYRAVAGQMPALHELKQRLASENPLQPYLLQGRNRALAAAMLQRHLQDLVTEQGGRVMSMRALHHETVGPLEKIKLNARFQVDTPGLKKVVLGIEGNRPLLLVEQMNITSPQSRTRSRTAHLDVRLTLSGLRVPADTESGNG